MLNRLISRSINEVISKLEGTNRQARAAYSIGSTVQPMVEVNLGVRKVINPAQFAGNATVSVTVPKDKVWRIVKGSVKVVTNGTAGNRYPYLTVVLNESALQIYGCTKVTAITASLTRYAYLNKAGMDDTGSDSVNISGIQFTSENVLTFGVTGGLAGDTVDVILEIKEFDVC